MQGSVLSFCSLMTPAGRKWCTVRTVRGHQLGIPFSELQRGAVSAVCFMTGLCVDAPCTRQRRLIVIVRLKRSVWCRSGSRGTKVWTMIHWFFSRGERQPGWWRSPQPGPDTSQWTCQHSNPELLLTAPHCYTLRLRRGDRDALLQYWSLLSTDIVGRCEVGMTSVLHLINWYFY